MRVFITRKGLLLTLVAGLAVSCSQQASVPQGMPDITVSALNGTSESTASDVQLNVTPAKDGYAVVVDSGKAKFGAEVYLAFDYDAKALHAENVTAQSSDGALGLAVEHEPGHIEFGLVSTSEQPLAAETPLLTFNLAPGAQVIEEKRVSKVGSKWTSNAAEIKPRYISMDFTGSTWILSWDYTNIGDTNQNSIVGIDDLSPLGKNYRRVLDSGWEQPLRNVDCDHNGEVNGSDLSPIGRFYRNDVQGYWIQASANGVENWISFAEVYAADQDVQPNSALRFKFDLDDNYQPNVYYRVQPFTHDRDPGEPSESVCDHHRILDQQTGQGDYINVVVSTFNLDHPLRMLDAVRVIYPDTYTYVPYSYNIGEIGGDTYDADGIWATFVNDVIRPPDEFYMEVNRGDGYKEISFAVAVSDSFEDHAQTDDGDLFNFTLWNSGDDNRLTLSWEDVDQEEDFKTTFYSDDAYSEHFFGNNLSFDAF